MKRTGKRAQSTSRASVRERLVERGIDFDAMVASLGHGIRARRKVKGLTQEALADQMGVSVPWVGVLECARGSPSLEMLTLLAHELNTDPGVLLTEAAAGAALKGPARLGLAEVHAALANLPPDRAEAVCAAIVQLCAALR